MKKRNIKGLGFYLLLGLAILAVVILLYSEQQPVKMTYSDMIELFETEQVKEFVVDGNDITLKLQDNSEKTFRLLSVSLLKDDVGDLIKEQSEKGIITSYDYVVPEQAPWWLSLIPYLLILGVFIVLWVFMFRQTSGGKVMSFGKAKIKSNSDQKKKVTFADVAGADEEKAELVEVVDFLKNPRKYVELGARIPRGILLVGPPGTGKTLLAKAVAGEAGVPFFSISGSDFVEMFVGVGASRVRDLFEQAKKEAPSIVFIDEIDAVGRHRGAGLGGGHDEREQTLNQLLVEMDGFGVNEGVIVIAATNRQDILDPALLRPGRFDRQVMVGVPDIKGREEILKVHARNKPLEENVNLATIAKTTAGFTGADLENLLNEAALLAARENHKRISMQNVEDSIIKVVAGPEKKSRVISDKAKKLTAYHEAGHAIVTRMLPTQDPVHQVSIIPRGMAGGYTLSLPQEDKYYTSKQEMLDDIVTLLGGRVAEKLVLGDISTGASNDIQRASDLARKMIMKYGMSDRLGPIVFGTGHDEVFLGKEFSSSRNYSEKIAAEIDEEVNGIVTTAYNRAKAILEEQMAKLHAVAQKLFTDEVLDAETFEQIFNAPTLEEPQSYTPSYDSPV